MQKMIRQRGGRMQAIILAAGIRGIHVIPSQANYVMVETERDAKELTKIMLIKYNLLIKELTAKTGGKNYLRLAVRNTEDNDVLLNALKAELG